MNFVKTKQAPELEQKKAKTKKKFWHWFALILGIIVIVVGSFCAYLYSKGNRIFQGNLSGSSLLQALNGNSSVTFNEDRINILAMGRGGDKHPGGLLTDSMMVISIKPKEKKVAMLSIPRDLQVSIKNHGQDKLNSVFADGYNDYMSKSCKQKNTSACQEDAAAAGANFSRDTVSSLLGIPIQYYVVADFDGFKSFIDTLGGVDVTVDKAIYDPLYPAEDMIHYSAFKLSAGLHHLDGDTALKYARSRETTSDFDRSGRQQKIIEAVKEKASQQGVLSNPKKIMDILNIVSDHVRTNLSPAEMKALADIYKDVDGNAIISKVLSDAADGPLVSDSSTGTYYLKPKNGDYGALKKIALNIFDTTSDKEEINVEVINGTKTAGLASKVAETVKGYGYTVTKISTSTTNYQKTTIYNYLGSNNKDDLNKLKTKFNAEVINKTKAANSAVDYTLIIGSDYQK